MPMSEGSMWVWLSVALGGSIGAVARFGVGMVVQSSHFPFATLFVNAVGSFVFGVLIQSLDSNTEMAIARSFMIVGFCGSFTTFSTFSFETVHLLKSGNWQAGIANLGLSILLCFSTLILGIWIGKKFVS
tara:strand:- start:731 stop:1120 length:390 start_codon:yes stop_codon:yes gene_type:complete